MYKEDLLTKEGATILGDYYVVYDTHNMPDDSCMIVVRTKTIESAKHYALNYVLAKKGYCILTLQHFINNEVAERREIVPTIELDEECIKGNFPTLAYDKNYYDLAVQDSVKDKSIFSKSKESKTKRKPKIYSRYISSLGVSQRAVNALNNAGFKTVGDLVERATEYTITTLRGVGDLTAKEILSILKDNDIVLPSF